MKMYACVGDSQVNISVKLTIIPHGLTSARIPAVLSWKRLIFLPFLHPVSRFSSSLSGSETLSLSKGM